MVDAFTFAVRSLAALLALTACRDADAPSEAFRAASERAFLALAPPGSTVGAPRYAQSGAVGGVQATRQLESQSPWSEVTVEMEARCNAGWGTPTAGGATVTCIHREGRELWIVVATQVASTPTRATLVFKVVPE